MSKFRHKLRRMTSARMFSRGADKVHAKNLRAVPMRGGFRL